MTYAITLKKFLISNPNNTAILNKEVLEKVFKELRKYCGSQEKISRRIGCSRRHLSSIIRKKVNPSVHIALNICRISRTEPNQLINKITPKFKCYGSSINPAQFPLILDRRIAALIGHALGDGHVGQTFSYTNKNEVLIRKVKNLTDSFPIQNPTINTWYHGAKTIRTTTLVRDIINCAQFKASNKITSYTSVPKWIKKSNLKTKAAFLQALFDDEGHINKKDRSIGFNMSKNIELEGNLDSFFQDIKIMLEEFGVERISITHHQFYKGKNGETISKNLRFYGLNNLKIFEKRINFVHPNKRKILTELINNYKRLKLHSEDRDRIFIKTLKRQDFLTAKEISAKVKMHHRSTLNYLNKLKDRKMIARTYDTWPNKWHLTKN